jgi:hypothetical protein
MTISLKKRRRRRRSVERQQVTEVELLRLWILSLPPGYRMHPTNGK